VSEALTLRALVDLDLLYGGRRHPPRGRPDPGWSFVETAGEASPSSGLTPCWRAPSRRLSWARVC